MRTILFVGERVNSKVSNIPFDDRMGSGKFLHKALISLPWYLVVNCAFNFDNVYKGNRINKELIEKALLYDRVIALGNIAFKELNKMNIICSKISHPSFYKRFKSRRGFKGYSKVIEEAIRNG